MKFLMQLQFSLKSIAIGCLKAIRFTTCCSIKVSNLSIFSSSLITASALSLFLVVIAWIAFPKASSQKPPHFNYIII